MRLTLAPASEAAVVAEALAWTDAHTAHLDGAVRDRLLLAVGEAVANASRHGTGTITLDLDLASACTRVTVSDRGRGVPPDAFAQVALPEDPAQTHGRGLYLIAALADTWQVMDGALVLTFDHETSPS